MQTSIPISMLAHHLERSEAWVRMSMSALHIPHGKDDLGLQEAIQIIRYFACQSGDQAALLSELETSIAGMNKRELELSIALEIIRHERDTLQKQNQFLHKQLEQSNTRAELSESRLHRLSESIFHLVSQRDLLVAKAKHKSHTVQIFQNGRPVLLLQNPVNQSDLRGDPGGGRSVGGQM